MTNRDTYVRLQEQANEWRALCDDYELLVSRSIKTSTNALRLLPAGMLSALGIGMLLGKDLPEAIFPWACGLALVAAGALMVRFWRKL